MKQQTHLSPAQLEAFGAEVSALHQRARLACGAEDVAYIRSVLRVQRGCEVAGRGLLFASFVPGAWALGVGLLSLSKILENMEIGHNVMHGQYDFSGDPALSSRTYEWDSVSPASQWKHSHNYLHHTFTNVRGVDHDLGYRMLRVSEQQEWRWYYVPQLAYAGALMTFFQWGVAVHDFDFRTWLLTPPAKRDPEQTRLVREIGQKAWKQVRKDYVLFPLLAGPFAGSVLLGNLLANGVRNAWAATVIFCGHFPEQAQTFAPETIENESPGHFYLRQLLGSVNFEGPRWLHILSGHLSHQIEHHLFPDVPAWRYPELSREMKAICARYDLPYNTGSLGSQILSAFKRIARLAFPTRTEEQHNGSPALV